MNKSRFDIFIYHDGSDCEYVENKIISKLNNFIENEPVVKIVNSKPEDLTPDEEGFLPEWNLGINIVKDNLSYRNLELIIDLFYDLSATVNRSFVVGYFDSSKLISEDLCFIDYNKKDQDIYNFLYNFFFPYKPSHNLEFFYKNLPVGYFKNNKFPDTEGTYKYMPYRGSGHYELMVALEKNINTKPICTNFSENIIFEVTGIKDNNSLMLKNFVIKN